jgi:hypothetical protein
LGLSRAALYRRIEKYHLITDVEKQKKGWNVCEFKNIPPTIYSDFVPDFDYWNAVLFGSKKLCIHQYVIGNIGVAAFYWTVF